MSPDATFYDVPASTLTDMPRGTLVRFRVGTVSAYAPTVYSEYSSSVIKNHVPNMLMEPPVPDKCVYAPGEVITLSYLEPDPMDSDDGFEGGISGYEAKLQFLDGMDYNGGQIVGTSDEPEIGIISISTAGWSPGQQWRFLVRGFDTYGVRGAWSAPSEVVMIGTPLKVLVSGVLKSVGEQKVLVNGELKQVSEIKVLVDGALRSLTV